MVCDGRIQATSKIHFAIAYDIVFEGYIFLLGFAPPPALSFSSRLAGKRVWQKSISSFFFINSFSMDSVFDSQNVVAIVERAVKAAPTPPLYLPLGM